MLNPKLFNPDYLLHLCQKYGLRPSKKYGQNFLIDEEVINEIINIAEVGESDEVVEVGPGFGILTLSLAERAKKVISFEIEKKLMPYWESVLSSRAKRSEAEGSLRLSAVADSVGMTDNLEIIWGNVLNVFARSEATKQSHDGIEKNNKREIASSVAARLPRNDVDGKVGLIEGGYKVIANIPYQITSPLIRLFLESNNPPSEMILMVQKEVAERICAKPGEMSMLALSVQLYAKSEIVFEVPRQSFWPEPKVDSAVIKLVPKPAEISPDEISQLFNLARLGFSSRRKVLLKNIKSLIKPGKTQEILALLESFGLTKTARAQELSLQNWLDLSASLR